MRSSRGCHGEGGDKLVWIWPGPGAPSLLLFLLPTLTSPLSELVFGQKGFWVVFESRTCHMDLSPLTEDPVESQDFFNPTSVKGPCEDASDRVDEVPRDMV